MRRQFSIVIGILFFLSLELSLGVEYDVIDLGTLGKNGSAAYGINNIGQIVGSSLIPADVQHAFIWEDNKITDLDPYLNGQSRSVAWGINDSKQIALDVAWGSVFACRLDSDASLTKLPAEHIYAINNQGLGIGYSSRLNGGETEGFACIFDFDNESVIEIILVGRAKVQANIQAIKAIKDGNIAVSAAAVRAALSDTQDLAEELLYAEARLGAMLKSLDKSELARSSRKGTSLKVLPTGINKKQSHYAQELSKNEDIIAQVVTEARENDVVPVRNQVLSKIKEMLGKRNIRIT